MKFFLSLISLIQASALAQSQNQNYDLVCRSQAKEAAVQTYQNCVTSARQSRIEEIRKEYQNRLNELKSHYDNELKKLSPGKQNSSSDDNEASVSLNSWNPGNGSSSSGAGAPASPNSGIGPKKSAPKKLTRNSRSEKKSKRELVTTGIPTSLPNKATKNSSRSLPVQSVHEGPVVVAPGDSSPPLESDDDVNVTVVQPGSEDSDAF